MILDRSGVLGFGAASIGNLYRAQSDAEADAVVEAAWDAGLRYFDTAPHYGFGLSERRLGRALARLDPAATAIVSTKVGRRLDPVAPGTDLAQPRQAYVSPEPVESVFDYSYDAVMRSWEQSRIRLRRDRIDVLYAHDIGRYAHGDAHPRLFGEFLDGGYRAMRELRDGGAVGAIGLGVNEVAVCEEMLAHGDIDVVLLAGRYTLLEQQPLDRLLPLFEKRNVGMVVGGPYNSGILATGTRAGGPAHYNYEPAPSDIVDRVRAIEAVCAAHRVPLRAAALQFPLGHGSVACVVPGMGHITHVEDAMAMIDWPIPSAFWETLRSRALLHPDAPVPAGRIGAPISERP
jgi:D-threo-aldose 1-dehydrogenase